MLLWGFYGSLFGQNYQAEVQHYGVENGLTHRQVEVVFQDQEGFIWLGTRFGLNRFDGYQFKSWTRAQYDYNFDGIFRILQDDAGWLWLYNEDREFIFLHPRTGEIRTAQERFGNPLPFQTSPYNWQFDPLHSVPDAQGRLHFITQDAEYTYQSQEGFIKKTEFSRPDTALPKSYSGLLIQNPAKQSYWELHADGWYVFGNDRQLQMKLLRSDYPANIFKLRFSFADRLGHVWLASDFGLSMINVEATYFQHYFNFTDPGQKPFNNSARGIWADEKNLFANFENGGLVKVDRSTGAWQLLNRGPEAASKGHSKTTGYWARPILHNADGSFWVGADHDIRHLDANGRQLEIFGFEHPLPTREGAPVFWSIYPAANGRLWLGYGKGLAYKDPGDAFIRPFEGLPGKNEFPRTIVLFITEDRDRNLWACTNRGLFLIDPLHTSAERYSSHDRGKNWLPAEDFQHLYQDKQGIFWLATSGNGLIRWDRAAAHIRQITHGDGLSNDNVYAVYEDEHEQLWLSSDYGISQVDKTTYQVRNYLPKDGLGQEEFNRVAHFQAADGSIYFGGLNGITAFQPTDFYRNSNDSCPVPLQVTTFLQFDPVAHQLTDHTWDLQRSQSIRIEPNNGFSQIEFALLGYENVEKIRYAWKIADLDADWTYQPEHSIRLSRLPFGTHTLLVKAQLANGQWSTQELRLPIVVIRPFYLTIWFFALLGLLLLCCLYGFYDWRMKRLMQRQILLKAAVERATTQIQRDKTVIEEQAAELRQLDSMKSRFFVNVSHELRTPLTLISGPAEHLLRHQETMTPTQRATLLRHLLQNSGKLLNLVEELLELSRLDARQIELHKQPVDFTAFSRRLFSAFEAKAQLKRLDYTLDYQLEPDCWLLLDPGRVEKIFNNLLANALQYTPSGDSVRMEIGRIEGAILVRVRDTGPGIHPDDLPYVFDRYFQSRQRERHDSGAAGIGLALARELAGLMAGQITVASEWGKGTEFTFSLPEEPSSPPALLEVEKEILQTLLVIPQPVITKNLDAPTILIVEDNADLRDYLCLLLEPAFNVVIAENGQLAWNLLERGDPLIESVQLVLSDIMMPEMDGFELLAHIKRHPRWRSLPVVLLTARSGEADRLQGLRLGVDDYLIKPFSTDELLARIHNLIGRYHERRLANRSIVESEVDMPDSLDERWLEQLQTAVREVLYHQPGSLSATALAERMLMSPRNFQRKIKQLTGLTPNQYITECRLDRARQLLENRVHATVREVAFAVGFDTPHYFSSVYTQRFGRTPASYWE